jgi:hypothetical protein
MDGDFQKPLARFICIIDDFHEFISCLQGAVLKWMTMKNLLELYKQAWTLAPLHVQTKVLFILRHMLTLQDTSKLVAYTVYDASLSYSSLGVV